MWPAIIGAVLPFVIQLATWFIKRSNLNAENKKQFLQWVKLAGNDLGSVKLHDYALQQEQWFKDNPWKSEPKK
jgi:hypothetical protein